MHNSNVIIYKNEQQLAELEQPWQELYQQVQSSPFTEFHWCKLQFSFATKPLIITLWQQGVLVAILPLQISTLSGKLPLRALSHLCQRFTDYQELLIAKHLDTQIVVETLLKKAFTYAKAHLMVWNYPNDAIMALKGERLFRYSTWQHWSIDLNVPLANKKALKDLSRLKKQLSTTGKLELKIQQPVTEQFIDKILDANQQRHGKSALNTETQREKIQQLFKQLSEQAECSFLTLDRQIIAGHLGFVANKTLYYYLPMMNREFSRYAPGFILLEGMYEHYKKCGYQSIDMLRGEEPYKARWANTKATKHSLLWLSDNICWWQKLYIKLWIKRNQ